MADPKHSQDMAGREPDPALDRPGVTGGVPDAAQDGESKGTPHSDREKTETAGNRDDQAE